MPPRNPTKPHDGAPAPDDGLSPKQRTAVDLLSSGRTLTDTAAALSVDRWTVSQWLNHSAPFQASLNSRRQQLWSDIVEGVRGLLPQALAVLQEELTREGPGRLQAAVHVFKMVNLYGQVGPPVGPMTLEAAEQAQIQREIERISTTLTPEDVALAEQRRQSDRTFAALTAFP